MRGSSRERNFCEVSGLPTLSDKDHDHQVGKDKERQGNHGCKTNEEECGIFSLTFGSVRLVGNSLLRHCTWGKPGRGD